MSLLKEKLAGQIPELREELRSIIKEHGDQKISDVNIAQAYGGMRGIKGMVCDTSVVEPDKGLIIRGKPILELTDKLPEEIFWLLFTGELPTKDEVQYLNEEWTRNYAVPSYVWRVVDAMPVDSHPMVMLSAAILSMQRESIFAKRYHTMRKEEYWEAALEDAMMLLARLPGVAAGIYHHRYHKGERMRHDPSLDWASNFVHQLGLPGDGEDCRKMMRLYLTLHSDHEGGNVSANTCHTVGSALSDPYYAVSAGLNGLAGPLHGLANQECLNFVFDIQNKFSGVPTTDELTEACWDLLNRGQVIPGYGHAVLRVPDPRFVAFHAFGKEHLPNDPIYQIVDRLFEVAPKVLQEHGKAKNPWPNVDAASGALLNYYGMREYSFYTVIFGVSRAMGMLSQLVLNRALGIPLTRPKSVSTPWIKSQIAAKAAG